jgi:two-component SAPR family response regulator
VTEFESLLNRAGNLSDDSEDKIACLKRALDLYKGQFLVEFYSEWTEEMRRQLEDKYLKALLSLATIMEQRRELTTAADLAEKVLDVDPYHEEAYHRLIKWQFAQGDNAAAEQTYRRYSDVVSAEMRLNTRDWFDSLRLEYLHD